MPHAVILNSASKANTAGGTFADSLTANSGDSLTVANYDNGGARVIDAWGIDSDSVAELSWVYTRPESTGDQTRGFRTLIPSVALGGAGTNAAFQILPSDAEIRVFKGDAATMNVTTTAADDVLVSWLTEYDDLPGVSVNFASWEQVKAMHYATVGFRCDAVASATIGAYGASRAFNADDTRWVGNAYYAILGFSVQTQCTTIAMTGTDWGSQKLGAPAGSLFLNTRNFFVDLSISRAKPLIPVLSSLNVGNAFLQVADAEANTSPKVDILTYQLTGRPG